MDNHQQKMSINQQIDIMLNQSTNSHIINQEQIPKCLKQFILITTEIPRFIRLKPNSNLSLEQLAQDLNTTQKNIVKVDQQFYALHPSIKINLSKVFEKGIIYGMDYSSAIPVRLLELFEGCKVLELCSAPGNKSMYMADSFQNIHITGVQININRADVMKSLIKKYNLQNKIKIVIQDGVKFDSNQQFDRVIVDAQCTHQGSLKHIRKFIQPKFYNKHSKKYQKLTKQQQKQYQKNNCNPYTTNIMKPNEWTQQDFKDRFLDGVKLQNLKTLQMGLLQNGFRLLKEGGILIYSTCSFDQSQNEKIISDFALKNVDICQVLDAEKQFKSNLNWRKGSLNGTIRFSPSISRTGGMFIAKIAKKNKKKLQ